MRIPRNYLPLGFGAVKTIELHHFSDASTVGYGQCSYLRFEGFNCNVHCTLVAAKGRVTPLRHVTVPRLELTVAVLSVKMARFLQEELDYDNIEHFLGTDSQIVLAYLNNESKRFHVFVANRVQQILHFSKACQWRHVSTKDNPVDDASCGLRVNELTSSEWFQGPTFLRQSLPFPDTKFFEIPEDDAEVKFCKMTAWKEMTFNSFEKIAQRFSTKSSLVRTIAVLVRKCAAKKGHTLTTLESYEVAERRLIVCLQKEHFDHPSASLNRSLQELNVYRDVHGVLRVGGRASKSSDIDRCKYPVVLPRKSHFSLLVAQECHVSIGHQGRMFTINKLSQWILGFRRSARCLAPDLLLRALSVSSRQTGRANDRRSPSRTSRTIGSFHLLRD